MARIDIRGVENHVILKLDTMAKKRGISREAFLRNMLNDLVVADEIRAAENKYENLVLLMTEVVENNNNELSELRSILESVGMKNE